MNIVVALKSHEWINHTKQPDYWQFTKFRSPKIGLRTTNGGKEAHLLLLWCHVVFFVSKPSTLPLETLHLDPFLYYRCRSYEKKMIYPSIVFIGLNICARRKETESSSRVLVKSRCMEALWESIFLLAVHGGSFSRPCWVKALILSSKASLPCQTGISDWGGSITTLMWTASQRAKRKAGEGGTMAGPSHRICADQALNGRIDAAA